MNDDVQKKDSSSAVNSNNLLDWSWGLDQTWKSGNRNSKREQ
jgi:hypothetical protein